MVKKWTSSDLYQGCSDIELSVKEDAYQKLWDHLFRFVLKFVSDQPNADAIAQDCAQEALIRIYNRLPECHSPDSFLAWSRKIAYHLAIDELRRNRRSIYFEDMGEEKAERILREEVSLTKISATKIQSSDLRTILQHAPISERSRRVIIGRFLDDQPDENLAQIESSLADQKVLPSHIQVTRTKDIAHLREFHPLLVFLEIDR